MVCGLEDWAIKEQITVRTLRARIAWLLDAGMLLVLPEDDGRAFYVPLLAPLALLAEMTDGELLDLVASGPQSWDQWTRGRWGGPCWVVRAEPRALPKRVEAAPSVIDAPAPPPREYIPPDLFLIADAAKRARPPDHIERQRLGFWDDAFASGGATLDVARDPPVVEVLNRWRAILEATETPPTNESSSMTTSWDAAPSDESIKSARGRFPLGARRGT